MRTSPKFLSVLFVAGISFFFFSFVLQQNNGGGEIIPQNQANTTTGGGVFQPVKFQDRLYVNENTPSRRPISYNYLRQGDVSFEKRVWRRIDLREKLNQPLMYPYNAEETGGYQNRKSFFDILTGAILDSLNPIAFFKDDEFKDQVMSREAVKKELMKAADSVKITDVDGNDSINPATNSPYYRLLAAEPYTSKDALQFAIKEDWFFDKQRSVLDVRILGLGIFLDKEYNIAGEKIKRVEEVGWVYFPQCRPVFARNEVYNPKNDSERRTYEDFFWKRMFSSYVTKESNTFNRTIDTYARGLDAMTEAERIKGDLFKWEGDLWHY